MRTSVLLTAFLLSVSAATLAAQNPADQPTTTSQASGGASSAPAASAQQQPPASGAPSPQTSTAANAPGPAGNKDPDQLLEVPPLPNTMPTLIGGTVESIDRVRNKLAVRPFGGKKMTVMFDERTRFFRNGVETTFMGIKKGDRVYVDSQLDGTTVFARNVRVRNEIGLADARGQIVDVNGKNFAMKDDLSGQTVNFVTTGDTKVKSSAGEGTMADVKPGSLVLVRFAPDRADRGIAQEIELKAAPGETFTFVGRITHLDIAQGLVAVQNQSDNRNYEIHFDTNSALRDQLGVGQEVTVSAVFDGDRYTAQNINVMQARNQ